jgi:hypothetical protein
MPPLAVGHASNRLRCRFIGKIASSDGADERVCERVFVAWVWARGGARLTRMCGPAANLAAPHPSG